MPSSILLSRASRTTNHLFLLASPSSTWLLEPRSHDRRHHAGVLVAPVTVPRYHSPGAHWKQMRAPASTLRSSPVRCSASTASGSAPDPAVFLPHECRGERERRGMVFSRGRGLRTNWQLCRNEFECNRAGRGEVADGAEDLSAPGERQRGTGSRRTRASIKVERDAGRRQWECDER